MSTFKKSFATRNGLPSTILEEPNSAAIPAYLGHPGMSVQQLLSVLRAHWKASTIIAVSMIFCAAIAIKFLPKTYTAMATLIVNSDSKDPLAGRDFPVEMLTSYVATQTELMSSPVVLLPVVDRLKLTADKDFTAGFKGTPEALREFVGRNLSMRLGIETGRGGQLLYVYASAKSAALAADIANAVADVYMEQDRNRLNDPAAERAKRYTEELAELREKTKIAQDKVTEFRKEHGISDINASDSDSDSQALDNLQQRLIETQNLRRNLEAKQAGHQSSDEAMTSTSIQQLKTQLSKEQSDLAELSAVFGPKHPKVRELNSQVMVTREALANETQSLSQNTETELARTRDLEQKYIRAVADQKAKVLNIRQAQDEGGKLVLELESAKAVYKHALDGFDQIVFASGSNHTNVGIVSRATTPVNASKPNKIKLMLMAFAAAIGFGVGVPAAYELFVNRRVRCRDDVERGFGIAVLAQLEPVAALLGGT